MILYYISINKSMKSSGGWKLGETKVSWIETRDVYIAIHGPGPPIFFTLRDVKATFDNVRLMTTEQAQA